MANQLVFHNTHFDIVEHNHQIWLSAKQLAEAIGYKCVKSITNLYNQNSDEFTDGMSQVIESVTSGNYRKKVRIFSLRGAHLIAMFARTPVAKEFRRWVLDILDREVNNPASEPKANTTTDERTPLRDAVNLLVGKKSIMYDEAYRYIHQRFNISHIDELPKNKIPLAIEYIYRLALDCEQPPAHNNPTQPVILNGRILTEYKNGLVYIQEVLKDEVIVGTMDTFEWIQNRAGFVVVRKELLEQINLAFSRQSSRKLTAPHTATSAR
ncbi:hypothetical protein EHB58_09430 [Salmonella enterica subsp. enterica serovar Hull]|uniref:Bro-N domain-containing protein n=1 Tax=Salmonella enterica subsp. enterica serovar Hull TaxID=1403564 RepID=A0A5X4PE17_SALET|nr:hypothetical protein [Salmonella enterica subsp. enterica serovar Hull]EBZ8648434.1 hypothetical protein [Salmonella enterica subsp. enterica serovar Hull]